VLSLFIVLVGGTGLALSYSGMARQEEELYRFLVQEEADLKKIEVYYVDTQRSVGNRTWSEAEDWKTVRSSCWKMEKQNCSPAWPI